MTELYRHIGEYTDVPAGDIGVGGREIGYLFGQYKRMTNRFEAGVLTGKGLPAAARRPQGGDGLRHHVLRPGDARDHAARPSTARRVVVSGAGNVALYTIEKVRSFGGKVIACSDRGGYVVDETGIDLELLQEIKEVEPRPHRRVRALRARRRRLLRQGRRRLVWDVPCEIALPSATQNELTGRDASSSSRTASSRSARAPTCRAPPRRSACSRTPACCFGPEGRERRRRRDLGPRDAAERLARPLDASSRPKSASLQIMRDIHDSCYETAEEYGVPGNYVPARTSPASSAWRTRCAPSASSDPRRTDMPRSRLAPAVPEWCHPPATAA